MRRPFVGCYCFSVFAILPLLVGQRLQSPRTEINPAKATQTITIPDGTPVEMRFAQAVVGKGGRRDAENDEMPEAEAGDKVRLVVAANVRVSSVTVIAKGAIGQATVTKVKGEFSSFSSGLGITLDWVEDVDGQKLPLRPTPTGEPRTILLLIHRTQAGVLAGPEPETTGRTLTGAFRSSGLRSAPAGTRIFGYLQGAATLDAAKTPGVPASPDDPAAVTFYRLKERPYVPVRIACDGKEIGSLEALQYLTARMVAGKHLCRAGNEKALEFVVAPRDERFIYVELQKQIFTLVLVSVGEGEDGIANSEPVKRKP